MSVEAVKLSTVQAPSSSRYVAWALTLARVASDVCNYCDHIEHNEPSDRRWISDSGEVLRAVACEIAAFEERDLQMLYAERLRMVERRNPTWAPGELDGGALAQQAMTWRDLQMTQAAHDRRYHPDVIGLAKFDQLRHYALHTAKLAGAAAAVAQELATSEDFVGRRLPDLLLFGLKLPTVMGERLPESALASTSDANRLIGA